MSYKAAEVNAVQGGVLVFHELRILLSSGGLWVTFIIGALALHNYAADRSFEK